MVLKETLLQVKSIGLIENIKLKKVFTLTNGHTKKIAMTLKQVLMLIS